MPTASTQSAESQTGATAWSEDWLAVVIGLLLFVLSLGVIGGTDILGWVVTTSVWTDVSKALAPASKGYAQLGGIGALLATYGALLAIMTAGAAGLRLDAKRFALGFTVVFALSYLCWIVGSQANLAVTTPADQNKFGIGWSLKLTNEGGYIVALLAGLFIGNFVPRLAAWMKQFVTSMLPVMPRLNARIWFSVQRPSSRYASMIASSTRTGRSESGPRT